MSQNIATEQGNKIENCRIGCEIPLLSNLPQNEQLMDAGMDSWGDYRRLKGTTPNGPGVKLLTVFGN